MLGICGMLLYLTIGMELYHINEVEGSNDMIVLLYWSKSKFFPQWSVLLTHWRFYISHHRCNSTPFYYVYHYRVSPTIININVCFTHTHTHTQRWYILKAIVYISTKNRQWFDIILIASSALTSLGVFKPHWSLTRFGKAQVEPNQAQTS